MLVGSVRRIWLARGASGSHAPAWEHVRRSSVAMAWESFEPLEWLAGIPTRERRNGNL